jgi:hypothetical protein
MRVLEYGLSKFEVMWFFLWRGNRMITGISYKDEKDTKIL